MKTKITPILLLVLALVAANLVLPSLARADTPVVPGDQSSEGDPNGWGDGFGTPPAPPPGDDGSPLGGDAASQRVLLERVALIGVPVAFL